MSSSRQTFRQTDVTKAIKGAAKAGLSVARFEITSDGRIVVFAGAREQDDTPTTALEQWRRERGQG